MQGLPEVPPELLKFSGCSAVDIFAEKLSVPPALLLDMRVSEVAAVCPEPS